MLSVALGMIVGFSLGLTGGGGAIFAVPLLVYGLEVPSRAAVGVSLVTVCATALVGFLQHIRSRLVEFPTGLIFALAGMLTAPLGAWLARQMPESVLLVLFGCLMVVIAARMWFAAARGRRSPVCIPVDDDAGPTCRRDPEGVLRLTSRCAALLALAGLGAGVLTGLFGVGGGFIIVPALVSFSGMGIQRAIGTSLLVISLISISGIASYLASGVELPPQVTTLFLAGSLLGLVLGTELAKRLSGARLQQVFAAAIVFVGIFVIARNLWTATNASPVETTSARQGGELSTNR
jgi:uncharacterized membrane protein YfcA